MARDLTDRRVLVAVGGGIAAYKVVDLVRRLLKRGADVRVMMTRAATRFVHPTTFAAISGHPVGLEMFDDSGRSEVDHLELPHSSDLVIVAPATADLLAKMAAGIADDLVTTSLLAARCPVLIAPAMNTSMWEHPATRASMALLTDRGVQVIGPEEGEMAAPGEKPGAGRMSEPEAIETEAANLLGATGRLAGRKVVVTAGRTEEPIDDVRVITNRSSGRMGVEVARAAAREGAEVVLVHGVLEVDPPSGVRTVEARDARAMLEAVKGEVSDADMVFYVAAVSDWRPKETVKGKIKKEEQQGPPSLEMTENPDIAGETAGLAKGIAVGFALEVTDDLDVARRKLQRKGLDAILHNRAEAIGAERSRLTWVPASGDPEASEPGDKAGLARWALDRASRLLDR